MAFADLDEDAFLEFEHWGLNDSVVEVDHVGRYLTLEIRILIHDRLELIFAETVGIDVVECSVEELGFVTEKVFIASNDWESIPTTLVKPYFVMICYIMVPIFSLWYLGICNEYHFARA